MDQGILPNERFIDVLKKYPFLFKLPEVHRGRGPMPSWASRFPITSNVFKSYTRSYLAGNVPEGRYLANMRAVNRGAMYVAEGVKVVRGDVQLTSQAQTIRLRLNAKNGGRIQLYLPRLVVDGTSGQVARSTFALRATGAKPGRISEAVTAVDRVLDLRVNPGTTEVVLDRRLWAIPVRRPIGMGKAKEGAEETWRELKPAALAAHQAINLKLV
jgi:hypothetical protein